MTLPQQIINAIFESNNIDDIKNLKNQLINIIFSTTEGKFIKDFCLWEDYIEAYIENTKTGIRKQEVETGVASVLDLINTLENKDKL